MIEMYYGPMLLVGAIILIASILQMVFHYKKGAFVFYSISGYVAISFMKLILGYGKYTIFESFDDIQSVTYYHYALPIIVVSVLLPIVCNIALKRRVTVFFHRVSSICLMIYMLAYMSLNRVSIRLTIVTYIVAVLYALFMVMKRPEKEFDLKKNRKGKATLSSAVALLWIIKVILFVPNELYLNNVSEFYVSYQNLMSVLLIQSLFFIVAFVIMCVFFITEKQNSWYCTITFALALLGYIQEMFLNGELGIMDGSVQKWELKQVISNCIFWISILAVIIILRCILKNKMAAVIKFGSVYICMVQFVAMVYSYVNADFTARDTDYQLTMDGILELDDRNNIIIFVLDWYDEQILDKVLAKDPTLFEPLKDFTHYKNMTSLYAFTQMSIPYMATGIKWEYDMQEGDYREYAYQQGTFLPTMKSMGYDIGLYSDMYYSSLQDILINYKDVSSRKIKFWETMNLMNKCAKYKLVPFVLKPDYWYATSEVTMMMADNSIYNANDDVPFSQMLKNEGLRISKNASETNGSFRFIHMFGAHQPYFMGVDGEYSDEADWFSHARGSLNIVYEYIEQMKKLGIYDNAAIIITADHGQNLYLQDGEFARREGFEMTSNPIFFLKYPNQHNTELVESMAPVSHEDLIPTVYKIIGKDKVARGRSVDEIPEEEYREREFIFGRHPDYEFVKYIIRGNVRDIRNWEKRPIMEP